MSKTFKVKTEYTFFCTWEVKAENKKQAKEFALSQCGCIKPTYHSLVDDINWDAAVHPTKTVVSVKQKNDKNENHI